MVYGKHEGNNKRLALDIASFLLSIKKTPTIVCIGSDKVIGDSLGVIVGESLKSKLSEKAYIYGDLSNPITKNNLIETIKNIRDKHPDSPMIVIDSVLGYEEEIGCVKTHSNGVMIGGEFGEGLMVGDYSILGVVACKGISALQFLGSVKLNTVVDLSNMIVDGVCRALKLCLAL